MSYQLMEGQDGVVRLDNGIGHLRGRNNGEGLHNSVRVLLTNLGDQESSHTGSGTTTQRVDELEALQAVARLRLLAAHVQHAVDQLRAPSV